MTTQFEIVALGAPNGNFIPNKEYTNPQMHLQNGKVSNGNVINSELVISYETKPTKGTYYTSDNSKYLVAPYARILIKRVSE